MTQTQPDPVTAYLARARERMESADLAFNSGGSFAEAAARSQSDVPHLLAAVEKVLELAGKLEHLETAPPSGELDEAAVRGIRWTATKVRGAISRELLGEGER